MKLTNKQIIDLANAHRALDAGRNRVVKDGDRECIVAEQFDFTGNFRFAMAMNMNRIDGAVAAYNKANAAIFRKHAVNGELHPTRNAEAFRAYDDELAALNEIEQDIDLTPIKREELNLDKNKTMPFGIVAALLPIMPDENKKPEESPK